MEIPSSRYYNKYRISNTHYLLMSAIEVYFGREIFKGEGNRIFYASDEFAFRQRINKLYPSVTPPYDSLQASQLQFPFANYFRISNWKIDHRPAIQNATAALIGFPISIDIPQTIRFLQAECTFSLKFYFNRDDDAQNCYDILMWAQNPSPKYLALPGLYYKNIALKLPIILAVENVSWTNEYKEKEWLSKNRILVVSAQVTLKSFILDQYAQGPKSSLFVVLPQGSEVEEIYITKESILDFLAFKNNPFLNEEFIEMDFIANFTPDPELLPVITTDTITNESIKILWDFNPLAREFYEDVIKIYIDNGSSYEINMDVKEFIIPNLNEGSTYKISLYFFNKNGAIVKATIEATTSGTPENKPRLEGLIGKRI